MFQGMFRKRGRPPDPPLQIGGYDRSSHDQESNQIPGHQLRDAPRQLPLPPVREFEHDTDVRQEQLGLNNAMAESSSISQQQDVDMLDLHNRRLAHNPREDVVMQQEVDTGNNLSVQPFATQHVDNISNSQDRPLALDPQQGCSFV